MDDNISPYIGPLKAAIALRPSSRTQDQKLRAALGSLEMAASALVTRYENAVKTWPVSSRSSNDLSALASAFQRSTHVLTNFDSRLHQYATGQTKVHQDAIAQMLTEASEVRQNLIAAWEGIFPPLWTGESLDNTLASLREQFVGHDTFRHEIESISGKLAKVDFVEKVVHSGILSEPKLNEAIGRKVDEAIKADEKSRRAWLDEAEARLTSAETVAVDTIQKALSKLESQTEAVKQKAENAVSQLSGHLQKAAEIERQLKEVASKSGVAAYATNFFTAAKTYRSEGKQWLFGACGAAAILVVAALLSLLLIIDEDSLARTIQIIVVKITVLATLSTIVAVALKNHRRSIHNAVVNEHRANALDSFEAFVVASKDEVVKAQVLLQATQMIYSHRDTGYDGDSGDARPLAEQAFEISKSVASRG